MIGKIYKPDKKLLRKEYYIIYFALFIIFTIILSVSYFKSEFVKLNIKYFILAFCALFFILFYYFKSESLKVSNNEYILEKEGLRLVWGLTGEKEFIPYSKIEDVIIQGKDLLVLIPEEGILLESLNNRDIKELEYYLKSKISRKPAQKSIPVIKQSEKVSERDLYLVLGFGIGAVIILLSMFYYFFINTNFNAIFPSFCNGNYFNYQTLKSWNPYLESKDSWAYAKIGDPGFKIENGSLEIHNTGGLTRTSVSKRFSVDNTKLKNYKIEFSIQNMQDLSTVWVVPYFRIHYVDKDLNNLAVVYWIFQSEEAARIFTKDFTKSPFYALGPEEKTFSYKGDLLSILEEKEPSVNVKDIKSIKISTGVFGFSKDAKIKINYLKLYCTD